MKLIVGLGNKGKEYELTRHNAGFMAVERLGERLGDEAKFVVEDRFMARIARMGELLLVEPETYMNESGRAVRRIVEFYKLRSEETVVIHDDLDIRLGEYKIQRGVGPKIHNGIESVEKALGTRSFLRVRLGVDSRVGGEIYGSGADYVLAKMSKEEKAMLDEVIDLALSNLAEALGLELE